MAAAKAAATLVPLAVFMLLRRETLLALRAPERTECVWEPLRECATGRCVGSEDGEADVIDCRCWINGLEEVWISFEEAIAAL